MGLPASSAMTQKVGCSPASRGRYLARTSPYDMGRSRPPNHSSTRGSDSHRAMVPKSLATIGRSASSESETSGSMAPIVPDVPGRRPPGSAAEFGDAALDAAAAGEELGQVDGQRLVAAGGELGDQGGGGGVEHHVPAVADQVEAE